MKKSIIFCIICVLLLSLMGCGVKVVPKESNLQRDFNVEIVSSEDNNSEDTDIKEITETNTEIKEDFVLKNSVAYVGYTSDSRVFSNCLNGETLSISSVKHLPIYKIESMEELDTFYKDFSGVFTFDDSYAEIPSFDEIIENYTDLFFERNSILISYVQASSGSDRYEILNIGKIEDSICVNIEKTVSPEVGTSNMVGWFLIAELRKAELENVKRYDSVEIFHNFNEDENTDIVSHPGMIEFGYFSFADFKDTLDMTSERVQTDGFINVEGREITSSDLTPIERAKLDASKSYEFADYYYDGEADVWMVRFWNSDNIESKELVFLDGNGFTLLVVHE